MALILCGDFNGDPYSGTYQLLTNGCIQKEHLDWFAGVYLAYNVAILFLNHHELQQYL